MFPLDRINEIVFADHYTYRTALPDRVLYRYDRETGRALELLLCQQAGVTPGNHTMYRFTIQDKGFYAWFSDDECWISKGINHRQW